MNHNQSSHFVWRPSYPSENLKTPRLQQDPQQPQFKTFSMTNPYAAPEEQQPKQEPPPSNHQFQELKHSKRENNSDKIYERGLTPQTGMNPFLQGDYVQDLETQNQFLKPINTNLLPSNDKT